MRKRKWTTELRCRSSRALKQTVSPSRTHTISPASGSRIAAAANEDPIAYWKKNSGDGHGREILAVLAEILSMNAAELPFGKDLENNIIYVWPYLAEVPLDKLTPAQEVDLIRLVGAAEAKAMREKKKWTWWRLTIGADGTWHSFTKAE